MVRLEIGKSIEDTRERLRALLGPLLQGQAGDKAQQFLWGSISETCLYAARRVPEISDRVEDVDRAMRWGFGWELGPFEIVDTLGVPAFAAQIKKEGRAVAPVIEKIDWPAAGHLFIRSEKGEASVFEPTGEIKKVGRAAWRDFSQDRERGGQGSRQKFRRQPD